MGIASGQALLIKWLNEKGFLDDIKSVCDLGSQEPQPDELHEICSLFHIEKEKLIGCSAREFYKYIGIPNYASIDFNGEHGSLRFDLNRNITTSYNYNDVFDLVTNFGTSEHCFNQFEVFRNIHNLCKVNGYILHTVPTQGWGNHCFFRYDKNFFEDIAAANNYQILYLEPFLRLKPYLRKENRNTLKHIYTLCKFVGIEMDKIKSNDGVIKNIIYRLKLMLPIYNVNSATLKESLEIAGKGDAIFNITLACIFKKNDDKEFITPIQGMYQNANNAI
jgi:hypothetical protein